MSIQSKQREYNTIDVLKFFFAICIVGIHSNLLNLEIYSQWMVSSMLFRLGVPFFFVVSGYFLAGKVFKNGQVDNIQGRNVIKDYSRKLLYPLILWGGVGVVLQTIKLLLNDVDILHLAYYTLRTVFYPLNAMWYVLASIIGAIILYFIYTRFKHWKRVLIIYSVIAYSFLLLCNNYYFLTEGTIFYDIIHYYLLIFGSARNGVFLAPVFMGIGFLLKEEKNPNWMLNHKYVPVLGLIIGIIALYREATLLFGVGSTDDKGFFISQLLLIPSIVSAAMLFNIKIKLPYILLRRMSISIFFTHCTIIHILEFIPYFNIHRVLLFSITLLMAILISIISFNSNSKKVQLIFG